MDDFERKKKICCKVDDFERKKKWLEKYFRKFLMDTLAKLSILFPGGDCLQKLNTLNP